MKITVFNGSPRGERGNTYIMAEAFLQGAKKTGAEVEHILLVKKNINHCMGCFSCWSKTPGKCVINDDMAVLLDKYINSDIVIYASPLYTDFVTGLMKDFLDRVLPIVCPEFEKEGSGESRHKRRYAKYPDLIMMSNCGFPEGRQFETLRLFCKRKMRNDKANVIAEIYRSQGELLKSEDPNMKPLVESYKGLLRKAAGEIVMGRKILPDTLAELEKPLIPEEEYFRAVNEGWQQMKSHD
ncbi:MAG: flavodoxin family protein [Candidatus Omnitrophica bacterium]|nr:flavodoxin family protein [Candidatus Omnitrophota bacterium]